MQTRRVVFALLALSAAGAAIVGYLGWKRRLPPKLAHAYGTALALASTAARELAPPAASADAPDGGDEAGTPHRVTQAAPLSTAQLGAPLLHGGYVTECGAPSDMKVIVKVTVRKGRAVAVKVTTTPPNPAVASCVEKAARAKEWDISPKTQNATVTY
jgi:hypothetical protein